MGRWPQNLVGPDVFVSLAQFQMLKLGAGFSRPKTAQVVGGWKIFLAYCHHLRQTRSSGTARLPPINLEIRKMAPLAETGPPTERSWHGRTPAVFTNGLESS